MTATGFFTQNQSYSCLLGRFQLFPLTHCCGPGIRHPEQQDKATQTLSPSSSSQDVMLPCGVTEEPRRLFYGSAGYRLHLPPAGFVLDPHLQEEPQEGQREARAEVQIARKLQCIADQFHRLHIQRGEKGSGRQSRSAAPLNASPLLCLLPRTRPCPRPPPRSRGCGAACAGLSERRSLSTANAPGEGD
ncbi:bcl-2-modifying factor isoform X4 [Hirundo rustica]|nr:bcl-2-modifying factor isoform X4 [Hirundo rustica]